MNTIPLINNAPSTNFSMNKLNAVDKSGVRSAPVNDAQLRQEVNTSIVALKREAFSLETLINQAAQELINLNNRIAAIEQAEGDYVKKADVVDTVTSGNMNPVTSNAVAGAVGTWETLWSSGNSSIKGINSMSGKFLAFCFQGAFSGSHVVGDTLLTITNNNWKPTITNRVITMVLKGDGTRQFCNLDYNTDGTLNFYAPTDATVTINGMYGNYLIKLE